jgi:hypothetical protein
MAGRPHENGSSDRQAKSQVPGNLAVEAELTQPALPIFMQPYVIAPAPSLSWTWRNESSASILEADGSRPAEDKRTQDGNSASGNF